MNWCVETRGNNLNDRRIDCPVCIPSEKEMGEFANAFRILKDVGSEWFLDFLVYSERENVATVVARVRVQEGTLAAIHDRLAASLIPEIDAKQLCSFRFPVAEKEVN